MKKLINHYGLIMAFGIVLTSITVIGLFSTTLVGCDDLIDCASGQCKGEDGHCYSCDAGAYCTSYPVGNCSTPVSGIYCCAGSGGGGGGGCTPTGCPYYAPWKCGGYCYETPPSGNHACIKCP